MQMFSACWWLFHGWIAGQFGTVNLLIHQWMIQLWTIAGVIFYHSIGTRCAQQDVTALGIMEMLMDARRFGDCYFLVVRRSVERLVEGDLGGSTAGDSAGGDSGVSGSVRTS